MHIPDGFLDAKTAIASGALAAAGVGAALWQAKRTLPARRVPLLGVTAAFIFAAQLLNFPVAGGTSGHLVGGVLAAVLLGPGAAMIVIVVGSPHLLPTQRQLPSGIGLSIGPSFSLSHFSL